MGWDVVQIGLRHDLPVYDPFATAQEVAKRMNRNVRLVYENKYEYDSDKNLVRRKNDDEIIELGKFEVQRSDKYLQMMVSDYQAKQILELVGMEKLRNATFEGEFAESIIDYLEEPFELYEIEDRNLYIKIFQENVDLDVSIIERWRTWEYSFRQMSCQSLEWLHNYRKKIYDRARMFGCSEVIICADQGPGMEVYDNANFPADKLKEYARSYQYLQDSTWVEESEKDDWKKHAKHIVFSSVFQNQLHLSDEDWVEVIYDDFSDIDKL